MNTLHNNYIYYSNLYHIRMLHSMIQSSEVTTAFPGARPSLRRTTGVKNAKEVQEGWPQRWLMLLWCQTSRLENDMVVTSRGFSMCFMAFEWLCKLWMVVILRCLCHFELLTEWCQRNVEGKGWTRRKAAGDQPSTSPFFPIGIV